MRFHNLQDDGGDEMVNLGELRSKLLQAAQDNPYKKLPEMPKIFFLNQLKQMENVKPRRLDWDMLLRILIEYEPPPPPSPAHPQRAARAWRLTGTTRACRRAGIAGTIAVVVALVTRVDVFGGLHWDAHDALTGLAVLLPVFLLGA